MIYREGKGALIDRRRFAGGRKWLVVKEVYRGDRLVWGGASSCFGSGIWLADKPWTDTSFWKNNR